MLNETSPKEIIKCQNVEFRYSSESLVFSKISCKVFPSDFYFLLGQSGAGKTSFLKLIYGEIVPTLGNIEVFGYDLKSLSQNDLPLFRQHIGLIFQNCRLIENLSIIDNVAIALHINGGNYKRAISYAKELLDWVGLKDNMYASVDTLSDGQKQRVAIARAVIKRPALLLADEPTGNLDDENAFKLIALFKELHSLGTTVILATHNLSLVKTFGYPQLFLRGGKLFVKNFDVTKNYGPEDFVEN